MSNPTNSTVSIAVATFNGSEYIDDQLRSFIAQTRPPDEVVACDDSSEDGTPEILERFARSAPFPVRVVRSKQRSGPRENFQRAIGHCSGDVILLSDQDDVWLPMKIERMEEVFLRNGAILVAIHDLAITDSGLNPTGVTVLQRTDQLRMPRTTHVTGSATAFRSSILPLLLPFPTVMRTYDVWIHRVGQALDARGVVEDVLSLYRRHDATDTNAVAASWNLRRLVSSMRQTLSKTSDVVDGERITWLGELESRVALLSEEEWRALDGVDRRAVDQFLELQLWAVEERRAVIEAPWSHRLMTVVNAYRSGVYEEFAGPGSAVRDLLALRRHTVAHPDGIRDRVSPRVVDDDAVDSLSSEEPHTDGLRDAETGTLDSNEST